MKCKNCGAELNNDKCEYCGTFYGEELRSVEVKIHQIFEGYGVRDANGRIHPCKPKEIIEITCIGDRERKFIEV